MLSKQLKRQQISVLGLPTLKSIVSVVFLRDFLSEGKIMCWMDNFWAMVRFNL